MDYGTHSQRYLTDINRIRDQLNKTINNQKEVSRATLASRINYAMHMAYSVQSYNSET